MPGLRPSRRGAVAPFVVMEVLAAANRRAAGGAAVFHLEIGEPAGGPPEPVLEAARRALGSVSLGYGEAPGLWALRAAIARLYRDRYGVDLPPARIVVTAGASGAFVLAFLAAFDAGDRVVVPSPGYPAYRNILRALDVEPVLLPTGPESRFQPTVAALDALSGPIHGLVLASPANPTGTMLSRAELAAIAAWCRARGVRLLVDEIYHGITYEEPAASALEVEPEAIVVNSFSKYWCMTGWRLGWLVCPEDLLEPVIRLAQNLYIAPSTIAQHAALAALDQGPALDARVALYRRNRDRLVAALRAGGLARIAPPDGAFYLWVDIRDRGEPATAFCRRLLEETGIALTPGIDFDPERGEGWVRISFAGPEEEVARAAERLAAWLARA
ncbi:MAG: aminotransferase class I/II-fold pyridoxal phosphate-dependent enzyme [Geminicoccaceae bacterium]|nr:aminotransferase class I/II-fold pyridoxal phosphate-dependent enzyme [Geminicoccaceae bacterium]